MCDLDLLRYSLDVFKLIADRGFDIVIPSNGASRRGSQPTTWLFFKERHDLGKYVLCS